MNSTTSNVAVRSAPDSTPSNSSAEDLRRKLLELILRNEAARKQKPR